MDEYKGREIHDLIETLSKATRTRQELYEQKLIDYLIGKLGKYDIPIDTIMEIAQYATVATILVSNAQLDDAYKRWERNMKRINRPHRRETEDQENG